MATLTQTAYISRKIIKFGAIGLGIFVILRTGFLSFSAYWKKAHPVPPPKPTTLFGKLPKIKFPARPNLPPITLKLQTVSGNLPLLSSQAQIFFIPSPSQGLLLWDNTKNWAKNLGFGEPPQELSTYDLRFTTSSIPNTTLDVNVLSRNFYLTYHWQDDINIVSQTNTPLDGQASSILKGLLQSLQALPDDLNQGPVEVIYYKYIDQNLTKALFSSEANLIKVNLFRKSINDIKVLPPNPKDSNVSALISLSYPRFGGIVDLKYTYFAIQENTFSTYPLKDTNTAWSQLAAGKGFIANLGNNPDGKVIVRNAYLAYYDSGESQNYLQPVIVFEGDNDFFAYVPAVSDIWVEQ